MAYRVNGIESPNRPLWRPAFEIVFQYAANHPPPPPSGGGDRTKPMAPNNNNNNKHPSMKTVFHTALLVATLAGTASAQGLFSGLSNRKEEIEKASSEFSKVILSCDQSVLLKGEMARKDDGTPDITFGKDGDLRVTIQFSVDEDRYAEFVQAATNTFAKYAEKILTPEEEDVNDGKRKVRVDDTIFVFPKDMDSAFEAAKGIDNLCHDKQPRVTAFLVDIDGNVIAEGGEDRLIYANKFRSKGDEVKRYPLEWEIALWTCSAPPLNCDKNHPHSISDLLVFNFSGGSGLLMGDGWRIDDIDWDAVGVAKYSKETGAKWKLERQDLRPEDLSVQGKQKYWIIPWIGKHDDGSDVEYGDNRGNSWYGKYYDLCFRMRKPTRLPTSFGILSNEQLNAVQGVRVCIGGKQYREFLTELKNIAEKDAAERKALEED